MNETVHLLVHELADSWSSPKHPDKRLGLIGLLLLHTEPVAMSERGGGSGKVTGSPAPWAPDVEALLTDIDAGARELEDTICRVLQRAHIERGGSRANTLASLRRLPDLVDCLEREQPGHWLVRGDRHPRRGYRAGEIQKNLSQWHRQARILLGVERKHVRWPLPCTGLRIPDDETSVCGQMALRQRPGDGTVVCGACGETYTEEELHAWFITGTVQ
jgi:hypothetical protein